jgi:hypothetical protein
MQCLCINARSKLCGIFTSADFTCRVPILLFLLGIISATGSNDGCVFLYVLDDEAICFSMNTL